MKITKSGSRWTCEVLFSVHIGSALAAYFCYRPPIYTHLIAMEIGIKAALQLRQTDIIENHFVVWVPTIPVAVMLLILFRVSQEASFVRRILTPAAGALLLLAPPLVSISHDQDLKLPFWECLGMGVGFLVARYPNPFTFVAFLVASAFAWWNIRLVFVDVAGFIGPPGIVLGFSAAAAWAFYMTRFYRQVESAPIGR